MGKRDSSDIRKKGDGIDTLLEEIKKVLPEGEKLYPDDVYTDKSMRFMAAEIIREKGLYLLDKEIPYGLGVEIVDFKKGKTNLYGI